MNDSAKQLRNAYHRKWRAAHKEQVSEYNSRYWERKAAALYGTSTEVANQVQLGTVDKEMM